jgi:hypothetical protein
MTTRNQSRDYSRAHRQLSMRLHAALIGEHPRGQPATTATLKNPSANGIAE